MIRLEISVFTEIITIWLVTDDLVSFDNAISQKNLRPQLLKVYEKPYFRNNHLMDSFYVNWAYNKNLKFLKHYICKTPNQKHLSFYDNQITHLTFNCKTIVIDPFDHIVNLIYLDLSCGDFGDISLDPLSKFISQNTKLEVLKLDIYYSHKNLKIILNKNLKILISNIPLSMKFNSLSELSTCYLPRISDYRDFVDHCPKLQNVKFKFINFDCIQYLLEKCEELVNIDFEFDNSVTAFASKINYHRFKSNKIKSCKIVTGPFRFTNDLIVKIYNMYFSEMKKQSQLIGFEINVGIYKSNENLDLNSLTLEVLEISYLIKTIVQMDNIITFLHGFPKLRTFKTNKDVNIRLVKEISKHFPKVTFLNLQ